MSKMILNVSNKTYTTKEVEKFLKKEQELRKSLKVSLFAEKFEVVELFPDDFEDCEDWLSELGPKPSHSIPWDLSRYPVKVFFAKGDNYKHLSEKVHYFSGGMNSVLKN